MRKLILALLLVTIIVLPLTQIAQAKPGIVDGVVVTDQNGDPFLVSGSGNILQGNYTYGTHWMVNSVDYEAPLGMIVRSAFPGVIARDELLKEMQWRLENKNNRIAYLKRRLELAEKEREE